MPARATNYRFFFEAPRFFPPADFPPLRFAERDFFEPPDFCPPLLPRLDFPPPDFLPRLDFPPPDFMPRLDFAPLDFLPRAFPPRPLALPRADLADDFDFDFFPAFFVERFGPDFLLLPFAAAFTDFFALAATAFTAFLAVEAPDALEAAARPTMPPITPPTTAPTGPATLPSTAPVATPAVCFEMGGISMLSDDELEFSVDF